MPATPIKSITDELLAEIEAAAFEATKGGWTTDGKSWVCAKDSDQLNNGFVLAICEGPDSLANAKYISKADPAAIASMATELRRLRAENEALRGDAGRYQVMRRIVCDEKSVTAEAYDAEVDRIISLDTAMQSNTEGN